MVIFFIAVGEQPSSRTRLEKWKNGFKIDNKDDKILLTKQFNVFINLYFVSSYASNINFPIPV